MAGLMNLRRSSRLIERINLKSLRKSALANLKNFLNSISLHNNRTLSSLSGKSLVLDTTSLGKRSPLAHILQKSATRCIAH